MFNNYALAVGINLKFRSSLEKWLKLKVRKFWELIHTFVEITGEKLVGGRLPLPGRPNLPLILNRVNVFIFYIFETFLTLYHFHVNLIIIFFTNNF